MKKRSDLVQGWMRKAESDLKAVELCLIHGEALDTACFHAQQATEKYIKAYLTAVDLRFPFIHNLEKLIELCAQTDPSFLTVKPLGQALTPYAVDLRYDESFWPSVEMATEARDAALTIRIFVLQRLPAAPDTGENSPPTP